MRLLSIISLSLLCGILGLAGGWFAGVEKGKNYIAANKEEEHGHEQISISENALANMGVEIKTAQLSNFRKYTTVPAVVEELSTTTQPIFAPVSGHIEEIMVQEHAMVREKEILIKIIRDPLPRVTLTLTEDLLKPVTEEFHESLNSFRRATKNLQILQKELKRLQQYSSDKNYPIVPKKRIIELEYDIERAKHEIELYKEELIRHGLSKKQINSSEQHLRIDATLWNKALKNHGLWPPIADKLYQILPREIQKLHWTIASIGELVAVGLIKEEFVTWLSKNPQLGKYFLEIGGLLQKGNTLKRIYHLFELNAFHSVVIVKAPKNSWDIANIHIKKHQTVVEGDLLITLKNPRKLYLVAKPEGNERAYVLKALTAKKRLRAEPLLAEEGPSLNNLRIQNIVNSSDSDQMMAYIKIRNNILVEKQNTNTLTRTWKLRAKQKYILKIPTQTLKNVYVLPRNAIAEDGINKVIFLQNGDSFRKIEVKVLYEDHEVAVISKDVDIFPGDLIVHQGAFALSLALKSNLDSGGHGHAH